MVSLNQPDTSATTPIYRQLYDQIALAIRTGQLPDGERLPATRELAGQLGLNRTTVSAAYSLLEADGLIEGQVGRGSFVRSGAQSLAEDAAFISFESSRPAAVDFPLAEFRATAGEVIRGPHAVEILQLGSPSGYGPLREYLVRDAPAEHDVLVTSGCQQALDLLQRVLAPAGETVLMEDPVYHGLRNVFLRGGARVIGVPTGDHGVDTGQLERIAARERPSVLLVTPNFQNPTGATMPLSSRHAILEIARQSGVTVVENDIYGDLRYFGEPLPRLIDLDPQAGIVLLRSFSKVAFPGLRVGWITAPRALIQRLTEAKQWTDLHSDQLSQAILLRFAESGRLAAHLNHVRASGSARLSAALRACEAHLPKGSAWSRPEGGMCLWACLPEPLDTEQLRPRVQREKVSYLPGSNFAVSTPARGALRLSFGTLTPAAIERGIGIIGQIAKEELDGPRTGGRFEPAMALV